MSVITYTPSGREAYECLLTTSSGSRLVVRGHSDGEMPDPEGDGAALGDNAALVDLIRASGLHEWSYRRFRAEEKRKSHRKEADRYRREATALASMVEQLGERTEASWCSACMTRTTHRHVHGMSRPTRTYLCNKCGSPTTLCAVPKCSHMASRGFAIATTPRYCLEHRHEIPSFEKLDQRLKVLDDYATWLQFEKRNAGRTTRIASIAVVGGTVLAPVAFVAAPAIGGAVGSLSGLSGAAATSHGLAWLGGGSLAAGGLGMAGGSAVVTALGGGLGSALGATVASEYVKADSSFRIERLKEGTDTPVIFATGFLTEGSNGWGGWEKLIVDRYPDSPVYRVHWGARELRALAALGGEGVGLQAGRMAVMRLAARASKAAVKRLGPLGNVLLATGIAKNPWSVARARSEMTGAVLADLIARTDQDRFILLGHSLGGRVMVTAAQALGTREGNPKIEAMHLLGAAVSRNGDWRSLNDAVIERVWNYRSMNDSVLAHLYRLAELGQPAVGRVGFNSSFSKIRDRNVTLKVRSHTEYVKNIRLVNGNGR